MKLQKEAKVVFGGRTEDRKPLAGWGQLLNRDSPSKTYVTIKEIAEQEDKELILEFKVDNLQYG